ncbi:MAG: hypothetical protein Q8M99_11675 [Methylotenera sp.]|nr:hypothetical protein [Methylotenera sp.]
MLNNDELLSKIEAEIKLYFIDNQLDFFVGKEFIGIDTAKYLAKRSNKHLGYHLEKGSFVFSIHAFVAKDKDGGNNIIQPIYIQSHIT